MLSVSKYDISHITDTTSVYKNLSRMDFIYDFCLLFTDFQYISGMKHEDILFWNSKRFCQVRIRLSVTVLTMYRYCILWFDQ